MGVLGLFRSSERRRRGRIVAALLATVITLGASTSGAQAAPSAHSLLTQVAKSHPDREVEVIAQLRPGTSARRARALVRSHHGRVTDRLSAIHGLVIRLPARQARALRDSKRVLDLTINGRVHSTAVSGGRLATTYPKTVGADKLWAAGITGKGVGVAVIDSGISAGMPDFKGAHGTSRIRAKVVVPQARPVQATMSATARTSPASWPATRSTAPSPTRRTGTTSASLPRPA